MVSTSAVSGMFRTRSSTLKDAWLAIATRPPASSCVPSPGMAAVAGPEHPLRRMDDGHREGAIAPAGQHEESPLGAEDREHPEAQGNLWQD